MKYSVMGVVSTGESRFRQLEGILSARVQWGNPPVDENESVRMRLVIRHGWLLDVVGTVRCADGIWFIPICGEIDDPEENPTHALQDHAHVTFPCTGDFDLGDDAGLWLRAAIPGVFHYAPLHVADGREFLLDAVFVAVVFDSTGAGVAYPFACTDRGYATGLVFSRLGPDADARERIARAFWGLLLSEDADRLSGFSAAGIGFDTGDDYTEIEVGYSRGEFYALDMRQSLAEEDA
jgi:hypothetical protein